MHRSYPESITHADRITPCQGHGQKGPRLSTQPAGLGCMSDAELHSNKLHGAAWFRFLATNRFTASDYSRPFPDFAISHSGGSSGPAAPALPADPPLPPAHWASTLPLDQGITP